MALSFSPRIASSAGGSKSASSTLFVPKGRPSSAGARFPGTTRRSAIRRLREAGYKVHIDDFGTGFSSLSYIDQLAVNAIKIDRSFTRAVGTDAVTAPLLPQMIAMAESLGVEVIVEGVETEVQRKFLSANEKPLRLQGWFFSKALSAEALNSFVDKKDVPSETLQASPILRYQPEAAVLLAPHVPQA